MICEHRLTCRSQLRRIHKLSLEESDSKYCLGRRGKDLKLPYASKKNLVTVSQNEDSFIKREETIIKFVEFHNYIEIFANGKIFQKYPKMY